MRIGLDRDCQELLETAIARVRSHFEERLRAIAEMVDDLQQRKLARIGKDPGHRFTRLREESGGRPPRGETRRSGSAPPSAGKS